MSRPTMEITESLVSHAKFVKRWYSADSLTAHLLADAILAALPQPPRPLAVGDVVEVDQ